MLTSRLNIFIEVVATNTRDLAEITSDLTSLGFEIESSEIVTNHYTRPGSSSSKKPRSSPTGRLSNSLINMWNVQLRGEIMRIKQ